MLCMDCDSQAGDERFSKRGIIWQSLTMRIGKSKEKPTQFRVILAKTAQGVKDATAQGNAPLGKNGFVRLGAQYVKA